MNSPKDIQKTNPLHAFFDAYSIQTTPFAKNTSGERAYARAERIVAALFLLTNHFNHTEQLRASLRKNGTELLSSILSLRTGLRSSGAQVVETALALVRELISLVRMSAVAGYISMQNAGEVIQALDDLGALLVVSQRSDLSEMVILTREALVPRTPGVGVADIKRHTRAEHKGQQDVKNTVTGLKENATDIYKTHDVYRKNIARSNARSSEILEILNIRGKLGIKDIYSNMPGCSEKMIQRELARLVSKGQIKKIGEKRWSTYELVL